MSKWQRRILILLGVIVTMGAAGYYWLFVDSSPPMSGSYAVDLAKVRKLAASMPGEKTREIRNEQIANYKFPAAAVLAGDGWAQLDIPIQSYQLVFPDHTAIIDTALDRQLAKDAASYAPDAYQRMDAAMDQTSLILMTHEHFDHMGGFARHPHFKAILAAAKLTKEQVDSPYLLPAQLPAEAMRGYQPLVYDRYTAVAPGVVLIKAPGHSPGGQMIYVQRADGVEYLFTGDIAWNLSNIEQVRTRARFVTTVSIPEEDRAMVMRELKELNRIHLAEPNLHIIPGHDPRVRADALKTGLFIDRFR